MYFVVVLQPVAICLIIKAFDDAKKRKEKQLKTSNEQLLTQNPEPESFLTINDSEKPAQQLVYGQPVQNEYTAYWRNLLLL